MTRPPSPTSWLWAEIRRRFGNDAAELLHQDFLIQMRTYNYRRQHTAPLAPPPIETGLAPMGYRNEENYEDV